MALWWLEPGWTDALCGMCGARIWPEGDPDHGLCFSCWGQAHEEEQLQYHELFHENAAHPDPETMGGAAE